MNKDNKYFVEHLACFVSRAQSYDGMDTIQSFSIPSKQQKPSIVTPPIMISCSNSQTASTNFPVSQRSLIKLISCELLAHMAKIITEFQ
jgi:hypothetical protein